MLGIETGAAQPVQPASFDVLNYLAERLARPSFIMVELGHGGQPVAYQQGTFMGQRAFIGIEAWLRDAGHEERTRLQALQAAHPEQHTAYIEQRLADDNDPTSPHRPLRKYGGTYDPTTILPDGAADEVFLANVFGDPHVADSDERTQHLLDEVSRLSAVNGVVVIRETRTPLNAIGGLTAVMLGRSGLQKAGSITPADGLWKELESLYDGNKPRLETAEDDFYYFLTKAATV